MKDQSSRAEEQQIDYHLLGFDIATDLIHCPNETDICFDECEYAFGIQCLAIGSNTIPSFLGTPNKITRGWRACLANCFKLDSPIPFVAPTKTVTRSGGSIQPIREFED